MTTMIINFRLSLSTIDSIGFHFAQVAFQEADFAGWNLWAAINDRPLLPFRFVLQLMFSCIKSWMLVAVLLMARCCTEDIK